MSLTDTLKKTDKFIKKTGAVYDKVALILLLLIVGIILIYMVSGINNSSNGPAKTDNIGQTTAINCPQTDAKNIQNVDLLDINTATQISSINYNTDVLISQNKKNIIPPVTRPEYVSYSLLGSCLEDTRKVLVVNVDGQTKVYPLDILAYHIAINDVYTNTPIVVIYSPISDIYRVFKTTVKGQVYTFGHSGALYKNTDLLVDFQTDTLWSALTGEALVGTMTGAKLEQIDYRIMNYGRAKSEFPEGQVMTFMTGFVRQYGVDPFLDFKNSNLEEQEPSFSSNALPVKQVVLGFQVKGIHYAVPTSNVTDKQPYYSSVNGQTLKVILVNGEYIIYLGDSNPNPQNYDSMYWYVWYNYYPDTKMV